jgi:hypothetical protein
MSHLRRNKASPGAVLLQSRPQVAALQPIAMLDDVEDLQTGRRLRDLKASPPSRQGCPVRKPSSGHDRPMQPMGVLAMPTDLEIQRGVEVPGLIMNLPQGGGMGDDGEWRPPSFCLNTRIN